MATTTPKNYAAGHFDVQIDQKDITAYVKSVDGGMVKASSVEEPMGPYHIKNRHLATREVDPIQIEMGMAGAKWALKAIEDVIERRKHARFEGHIAHADLNMKTQYTHEFKRALLTEVTLPKLDAKSKEVAMMKVKLQPETVTFNVAQSGDIKPNGINKQKLWTCSNFEFHLDGIDEAAFVTSIDALTIKIGVKAYQAGGFKLPTYVPTKLEFPKLTINVPMRYSKPFVDWYNKCVNKEGDAAPKDSEYEKNGSIEFKNHHLDKTLYSLDLYGLGPETVELVKADANQDGTKSLKMVMYITKLHIKSSGEGLA